MNDDTKKNKMITDWFITGYKTGFDQAIEWMKIVTKTPAPIDMVRESIGELIKDTELIQSNACPKCNEWKSVYRSANDQRFGCTACDHHWP